MDRAIAYRSLVRMGGAVFDVEACFSFRSVWLSGRHPVNRGRSHLRSHSSSWSRLKRRADVLFSQL